MLTILTKEIKTNFRFQEGRKKSSDLLFRNEPGKMLK